MSYQFARLQDDGRLASVVRNGNYNTLAELKASGPSVLAGRRGGGRIVVVHILEVAVPTSDVSYIGFKGKQQEKP